MITETQQNLLRLTAHALFGAEKPAIPADTSALYQEAGEQTVLPLVYSVIRSDLSEGEERLWRRRVLTSLAKNLRVEQEHIEAHRLFAAHGIPNVILKGCASAHYYPDPVLREMGDVDILVHEADIARAGGLLTQRGFTPSEDTGGIHIVYSHASKINWELHRTPNGIPDGKAGERCRAYLSDLIETAVEANTPSGSYLMPDTLHHGLVLLLHTAAHLTSEGVGLRHLCDWAVFVAALSEDEFAAILEEPLRACGLWRFAQLLTLTSVRYLGCPAKAWAGTAEDELLEGVMTDILNGGNFGQKDADRPRHIKYMKSSRNSTIDDKNLFRQGLRTIAAKAKEAHPWAKGVLLPAGCVMTGCGYVGMLLRGERKLDNGTILKQAEERKNIYKEFRLFEV